MKIKEITQIALMSAIIVISAWVTVPAIVPFTLQTFGVYMALLILGGKNGTISIIVYILLGMVGLPVFSGGKGGLSALLGSTGGYIVGFVILGLVYWATMKFVGDNWWMKVGACVVGTILLYIFGTVWFVGVYTKTGDITFMGALQACVIPFILVDAIKLGLAYTIYIRLKKYLMMINAF